MKRKIPLTVTRLLCASATLLFLAQETHAQNVLPGFNSSFLAANDDGSTGSVNIGFTINFFGTNYTNLFANNNGNVTFDSPLSTFTPFDLNSTNRVLIAPFFADVDTRNAASDLLRYGSGTLNGHTAFGVTWDGVGYFSNAADKLNSFQVVLEQRLDSAVGDFDIHFFYDQIQWETGNASGGTRGLGGASARVGYSNGMGDSFELPGSAINGAFLDGGPNSLVAGSNIGDAGHYVFSVRNGEVVPPTSVPDTGSNLALLGLAAVGVFVLARTASPSRQAVRS